MTTRERVIIGAVCLAIGLGVASLLLSRGDETPTDTQDGAEVASADSGDSSVPVASSAPQIESAPAVRAQPSPPTDTYRLYGTVTDAASGAAVEEAMLRVGDVTVLTDATGAFESIVPADSEEIVCTAAGYSNQTQELAEQGKEVRIDFFLEPGISIAGSVIDRGTGAPIEGVRVTAVRASLSPMDAAVGRGHSEDATTGADGAYTLDGLEEDSYRVVVQGREKGYLFDSSQERVVSPAPGTPATGVDFELQLGAIVRGTVSGENGEPVNEARITLIPDIQFQLSATSMENMNFAFERNWRVASNAEGEYTRQGLDFGQSYIVRVEAEGFATSTATKVTVPQGQTEARADIQLSTGSNVDGVARYEDGSPASDIELTMMPRDGFSFTGGRPSSAKTGAEGQFSFSHVGEGDYAIQNLARFTPMGGQAVAVRVDGRTDIKDLEVVFPTPEAAKAIRGIVLAENGRPIEGVTVELDGRMGRRGQSQVTDSSGQFVFDEIEGFLFTVTAKGDLGTAVQERVNPGAEVTLTLTQPATIEGTVVTAQGQPAARAQVTLEQPESGDDESPAAGFMAIMANLGGGGGGKSTDGNGRFAFEDVSPGTYVIKAKLRGSGEGTSHALDVYAGQSVQSVRIVLEEGMRVAGTVRDPSGQPLANASVSLVAGGSEEMSAIAGMIPGMGAGGVSGRTDESGAFELADVAPGAYSLVASHSAFARATLPEVVVTKGRDVLGLDVRLAQGGRVSGILTANGQPRGGIMVNLIGPQGTFMAVTNEDGSYSLEHVPQGSYIAMSMDMQNIATEGVGGMNQTQQIVDVSDNGDVNLDFSPPPGSVQVTGQLSTPNDGLTVAMLRREGGPSPLTATTGSLRDQMEVVRHTVGQAIVGADGSFQFDGVPPGTYIMDVFSLDVSMTMDPERMMSMDPASIPHVEQVVTVTEQGAFVEVALPGQTPR